MKVNRSVLLTIAAALLLGGGIGWRLARSFPWTQPPAESPAADEARDASLVELPPQKLEAAGISTTTLQRRPLAITRTVPGRVRYDDERHIEIKLPTAGILAEIRVEVGDLVQPGQVLAVLSSAEVGNARADVLRRSAEVQMALTRLTWEQQTCDGLVTMVKAVEQDRDVQAILEQVRSTPLGEHREQVMSAYSRYRMSQSVLSNLNAISNSGAVPLNTMEQRRNELAAAQAALKAVTEQSLFEARQQCASAQLAVSDARRRLDISEQNLETLLGYREQVTEESPRAQALSLVEVRAPFAGTIEDKRFSTSERIEQGAALFVLADTTRLWIAADIREREWEALALQPEQKLRVTCPAMPNCEQTASLRYVGREVDPLTNAVPLVASIDNQQGRLRPGQFVRVQLPLGEIREALALPEGCVMQHAGASFVFVRQGPTRFRKTDIVAGAAEDGWVEVISGLKENDEVVVDGAFYLMSELTLEGEDA